MKPTEKNNGEFWWGVFNNGVNQKPKCFEIYKDYIIENGKEVKVVMGRYHSSGYPLFLIRWLGPCVMPMTEAEADEHLKKTNPYIKPKEWKSSNVFGYGFLTALRTVGLIREGE